MTNYWLLVMPGSQRKAVPIVTAVKFKTRKISPKTTYNISLWGLWSIIRGGLWRLYKVEFKSSSTFQIARFLVPPSVLKFYRLSNSLSCCVFFFMTFGYREAKISRWQYFCCVGREISIEQRANIKFCFKLGKTFI